MRFQETLLILLPLFCAMRPVVCAPILSRMAVRFATLSRAVLFSFFISDDHLPRRQFKCSGVK